MGDWVSLSGKVALITGAGQGVGRAAALTFAADEARAIVLNDIVQERAQHLSDEISRRFPKVQTLAVQADVTSWDSVQKMADEAVRSFGQVDILVNNAGNAGITTSEAMRDQKNFIETDPPEWEQWIRVNFYGPLYTCRALVPQMVQHRYGRVINIISDAGRVGEPKLAVYAAAKAGSAGFIRALAKEVGKHHVTANCVALGTIRTPAVAELTENPEIVQKMTARYPLRRLGEPQDVANLVTFLASEASNWITGQTYPVNGGYSFSL